MLRFAIKRAFWAIPTLFGISIVVFLVASLVPEPQKPALQEQVVLVTSNPTEFDALEEAQRERFLNLPRFFNADPHDVRTVVDECVVHLAAADEQAPIAAHRLEQIGSAAFPHLLPSLDKLAPDARARVAMALRPIAVRMGLGNDPLLGNEAANQGTSATLFWSRLWADRSVEFSGPNVRRAVSRVVSHASDVREQELISLDTFILDEVMNALPETQDPAAISRLLAILAHVTDQQDKTSVADWERWWLIHRSDYVVLDGVERVASALSETRYGKWLLSAARGQLGISSQDGKPVAAKLAQRAGLSFTLTLASMLLSYALAVPIGVISAWRRGRSIDVVLALVLFVMYSLPTYVFAELFVRRGGGSNGLILPILAMTLGSLASLSRYQRTAMLDVLRQDYVRTARSKGMSAARVLIVHALRNAMMPTLSLAGLQLPTLFGSAIVVEEVFGLHGLGFETMRAVETDDSAWLIAIVLLTAIATTIGLLATDVAYGVLDPRLRERLVKAEIA